MATVLVVEDDLNIRSAYMYALGRAGYEVHEAADGAAALAAIQQNQPDVIILDMLMPGISGVEFLRHIDLKTNYPKTTVLAVSNIDNPHIVEKAKELGAAEYRIKVDLTPQQMVELVGTYCPAPPQK